MGGRGVDAGTAVIRTRSPRAPPRAPSDRPNRRRVVRLLGPDRRSDAGGRADGHGRGPADDDRPGPAAGPRSAGIVDRDRGPPPEQRSDDHGRASTPGRNPGRDAVFDRGGPAKSVGQDLDPPRSAAVLRAAARGRPRERPQRHPPPEGRGDHSRCQSADRRRRRRQRPGNRGEPQPAGRPESAAGGRRATDRGRPAEPDPGVVRAGPARLAGRRRIDPRARSTGRPPRLAGTGWPARHRGRDRRDRSPGRVPSRRPAIA
jgi:hypothetical protein